MTTYDAARLAAAAEACSDWRVHHELPNRTRFRLLSPPRRGTAAAHVEHHVQAVPGVHRAAFTVETGSLLVEHDGAEATRRELRRALAALRMDELPCTPADAGRGGANDVVRDAVLSLLSAALPPAPRAALKLVQSLRAATAR